MPTTRPPEAAAADDEAFMRRMRQAVAALPDVPPALERRALALFPAPSAVGALGALGDAAQALAHGLLRQLTAVVSFDSWAAPAVALGMRSLRASTRHLLFSAEGRDIDLRITPAEHAFALAGQILGPDEAGEVQLLRLDSAEAETRLATLDGMGEFRIEGLAAGAYQLTLKLGSDQILLPPLDVGEPPR